MRAAHLPSRAGGTPWAASKRSGGALLGTWRLNRVRRVDEPQGLHRASHSGRTREGILAPHRLFAGADSCHPQRGVCLTPPGLALFALRSALLVECLCGLLLGLFLPIHAFAHRDFSLAKSLGRYGPHSCAGNALSFLTGFAPSSSTHSTGMIVPNTPDSNSTTSPKRRK